MHDRIHSVYRQQRRGQDQPGDNWHRQAAPARRDDPSLYLGAAHLPKPVK
jgi:hypothetical protein